MQAGLSPTGIGCSGGSSNSPLLLSNQRIRLQNAADSSPWKPALSLGQSNTVPNSWLGSSSSPWRSIHWRVCSEFSRFAHPTLVSLSSAHIPVCLSALIPTLHRHNLISLQNANDQKLGFHSKCCVLLAIDLGGLNFCLSAISSCCSLGESRTFTGNDCLKDTETDTQPSRGEP